jgi:hypothetical protein
VGPQPGANRLKGQGCLAQELGIELAALDPVIAQLQLLRRLLQANERLTSPYPGPAGGSLPCRQPPAAIL